MIQTLSSADWDTFSEWADAEGWKIPLQEQRLFQNQWQPYFFVLKEQGKRLGFISAIRYRSSGWIGNLLVHPQRRTQGHGTKLLRYALAFLDQPQVERIWLTASDQGAALYRKYGFQNIDKVERWTNYGTGDLEAQSNSPLVDLLFLDTHNWGESREPLLNIIGSESYSLRHGTSLALLQPGFSFWQLGPWLFRDLNPRDLHLLLKQAREMTPAAKPLVCDILESAEVELILRTNGFKRSGVTQLMALSHEPLSCKGIISLASLGSIG